MKLNKQQVGAISIKIYEKVKEGIVSHNKAITDSEEFKIAYQEAKSEIAEIKEKLKKFCTCPSIYVDDNMIAKIIGKEIKSSHNIYEQIQSDIILGTIPEGVTVDALIESISSKYI